MFVGVQENDGSRRGEKEAGGDAGDLLLSAYSDEHILFWAGKRGRGW